VISVNEAKAVRFENKNIKKNKYGCKLAHSNISLPPRYTASGRIIN